MAVLSPARSRALLALQGLRGRRDPSSFEWEVADRAIDMALSPERPESPFLVRHCLRNASSVLALSRRRARVRGMDEVPVDDTVVMAVAGEAPSAFDALAWSQVYSAFAESVAALHPHASAVLTGMEAGEPVVATAAALGISDRLVKSLRSTIRSMSGAALAAGRT